MSFNSHQWYLNGLRKGGAANTLIGGVASVINTPALLATKLQNYPSGTAFSAANIQNFTIVGSDIECYIRVDYKILDGAFAPYNSLFPNICTYYIDKERCKATGQYVFGYSTVIKYIELLECISVGDKLAFRDTLGSVLETVILPKCTTFLTGQQFRYIQSLKTVYIPLVTQLGATVTSGLADQIFFDWAGTGKIYANNFLQTSNAGAEEGDIAYARSRSATIRYVQNFTSPSAITNLTIGTIAATTLQLNFTAPTGSTNAIDFYEVWLNGVRTDKIVTASGQNITGLTTATLYNVKLKAVDIYYNKSEFSNTVTATTL